MDKSKILVTGGAGYIGSHTVVSLIEAGFEPIILDDFRNSSKQVFHQLEQLVGRPLSLIEGDLTNPATFDQIDTQNLYGVIHFAAYKAVGESVRNPLMYYENNVGGLIQLLQWMQTNKLFNLVFSSSCTVYGEPSQQEVDELFPAHIAHSPYGRTKVMCEQILQDLAKTSDQWRILALRYFNPVGAHPSGMIGELPSQTPNNLLPYITQTGLGILQELSVFGSDYDTPDGTCIRDYIHVMDLAEAHVEGLKYIHSQQQPFDAINLGTGKGTSTLEMIQYFEEISEKKLAWKYAPRRPGDVTAIYANAQKAKDLLNWSSKRTAKDAVKDAWNWEQKWRNQ